MIFIVFSYVYFLGIADLCWKFKALGNEGTGFAQTYPQKLWMTFGTWPRARRPQPWLKRPRHERCRAGSPHQQTAVWQSGDVALWRCDDGRCGVMAM
jgi:hypothetical protein